MMVFPSFAKLGRFKRGSAAASQAQYLSTAELKSRLKEMKVPHNDCLDKVSKNNYASTNTCPTYCDCALKYGCLTSLKSACNIFTYV